MLPALVPDQFSTLYALLVIFMISTLIISYYYVFVLGKFARYKPKVIKLANQPPVSVVICAKNEEQNLKKFLPAILEQDYPEFEVVVVNDHSSDETSEVLDDFRMKYPHLKVVTIREEGAAYLGKKFPLTMGLKAAKNEWVLLTDADCRVNGPDWISAMASNFTENCEVVLGFGAYEKGKGLLNRLIRFDTCFIALQYFSFALKKMPYMGTGRNLAYRKDLFFRNKGFAKHYHLPSGDDDLFINRVSSWHNTELEVRPESHTVSIPETTWGSWIRQKKRHMTTGGHYKLKHKFNLGILFLSNWLSTILFFILIGFNYAVYLVIPVYLLKVTLQLYIFKNSFSKLGGRDLLAGSLIYDLILLILYPIISLAGKFSKTKQWN